MQATVLMILMYIAFNLKDRVEAEKDESEKAEKQDRLSTWMGGTFYTNFTFYLVQFGVFTYDFVQYCETIGDVDKS